MSRRGEAGFTYLWLLFAVAGMGLLLAAAAEVWDTAARREKEAELLFIGGQFARAIAAYHARSPGALKQYPEKLEDLIEDKRPPAPLRHLRKVFRDPMTNSAEWGLVRTGGRIVGVHSRSAGKPLRIHFDGPMAGLAGAASYEQWVFGPEIIGIPIGDVSGTDRQAAQGALSASASTTADTPAAPEAQADPCRAVFLAELRQCSASAAGQVVEQLYRCNAATVARFSACRQGG